MPDEIATKLNRDPSYRLTVIHSDRSMSIANQSVLAGFVWDNLGLPNRDTLPQQTEHS